MSPIQHRANSFSLICLAFVILLGVTAPGSAHPLSTPIASPPADRISIISIGVQGVGTFNGAPQTGFPVELSAKISNPGGYTITKCSWTGNITPGYGDVNNECRYRYTPKIGPGPSDATYGPKQATLFVFYNNGSAIGSMSKTIKFKVFFSKNGDDANSCSWWKKGSTCTPNWFRYWNDDGAVTQFARDDIVYDASLSDNTYGEYNDRTDKISIGPSTSNAVRTYEVPSSMDCPGGEFGGVNGIDLVAETIDHEARHKWIRHNWDHDGSWYILKDSDRSTINFIYNDRLPDIFETEENFTSNESVDSCSLSYYKHESYRYYGDNEFQAITHSDGKTGNPANDWASPGKQNTPSMAPEPAFLTGAVSKSSPAFANAFKAAPSSVIFDEMGFLTGSYSDAGIDENSNGLYDRLKVTAGVHIAVEDSFNLVGWLSNGSGEEIGFASVMQTLAPGDYNLDLLFLGKLIRHTGFDGPYKLSHIELRVAESEDLVQEVDDAYNTGVYTPTQFEGAEARFDGVISDEGVDTQSDGQYDLLRLNVGINVNLAGTYRVIGELEGPAAGGSLPIFVADQKLDLSGGSQTVQLDFNGANIYQSHQDGPYQISALRIENAGGEHMDFLDTPYTTNAYTTTEFVHSDSSIDPGGFSDQRRDTNSDGVYEYLRFDFSVNAGAAGKYSLIGELVDADGNWIDSDYRLVTLAAGSNAVYLEFSGKAIYQHGKDGPYKLANLNLLASNGNILDGFALAHTTSAYPYISFARPALILTGQYSDSGIDGDGDGKFDQLKVSVGIDPRQTGEVTVEASLVDKNGRQIQESQNTRQVSAGAPVVIDLFFDGFLINVGHVDGPYTLKDLVVYFTVNPDESASQEFAYQTTAYPYSAFTAGAGSLYLPIVMK